MYLERVSLCEKLKKIYYGPIRNILNEAKFTLLSILKLSF